MQFQEMLKEEREQGLKEGAEETLIKLIRKGLITKEAAAEELSMTPDAFEDIMKVNIEKDSLG